MGVDQLWMGNCRPLRLFAFAMIWPVHFVEPFLKTAASFWQAAIILGQSAGINIVLGYKARKLTIIDGFVDLVSPVHCNFCYLIRHGGLLGFISWWLGFNPGFRGFPHILFELRDYLLFLCIWNIAHYPICTVLRCSRSFTPSACFRIE